MTLVEYTINTGCPSDVNKIYNQSRKQGDIMAKMQSGRYEKKPEIVEAGRQAALTLLRFLPLGFNKKCLQAIRKSA